MIDTQKEIVKDSVRRLYGVQQEKKDFDKYYNEVRKKEQLAISNFMFSNLPKNENSFEIELDEGLNYYTKHVKLNVTRVRAKKVVWNTEKLKERLTKKLYKSVTEKTYIVNDMAGLVEYLKTCGVNPKKFKQYIDVEEIINGSEMDRLYDTGKINMEYIKGCYEIKYGEPYIELTELKR